jgi:hypothetical protein
MVEVGDRVLVESEKVGSVTRSGVVTAVDDPLITVRWDSGSESVFVPSAGSLRVTRPRATRRAGRQVLSAGDGDGRPTRGRPRRVQVATSSGFWSTVPEAARAAPELPIRRLRPVVESGSRGSRHRLLLRSDR